jgi:hypothetical protein
MSEEVFYDVEEMQDGKPADAQAKLAKSLERAFHRLYVNVYSKPNEPRTRAIELADGTWHVEELIDVESLDSRPLHFFENAPTRPETFSVCKCVPYETFMVGILLVCFFHSFLLSCLERRGLATTKLTGVLLTCVVN